MKMDKEERLLTNILIGLFCAWVSGMIIAGVYDATKPNTKCQREWARIDYVLPFYRLGCWLGK